MKVYIDLHGKAELWDEHRAQDVTNKYRVAVKALGLENAGVGEQIEAVAKHYGKSERTVKRWRSLMGVTKGGKNVGTKGNSREGKELG